MPMVHGFGHGVIHAAKPLQQSFSPTSIPGLQLWLSTRYPSSMLQERSSATTLAAANGNPIGTWQDLSGNARHVTASTDAKRPTLALAAQNGLPGIINDATDDLLSTDGTWFASLDNVTIYAVAKPTAAAAADNSTASSPLQLINSPTNTVYWYGLGSLATTLLNGEKLTGLVTDTGGQKRLAASSYSRTANTSEIWSGTYGTNGTAVYVNGTQLTLDLSLGITTSSASGPSIASVSPATLFIYGSGGTLPQTTFLEIMVFEGVHSTSQRQYIQRGLGAAYGITVS